MARWQRYFSAAPTAAQVQKRLEQTNKTSNGTATSLDKYGSPLPEVYSGSANRIERYMQYEQMDNDSDVNRALDIIADFSTQTYEIDDEPFTILYGDELTETEIKILKEALTQWTKINNWRKRCWRTFRNTLMYGDQFFIRDPETCQLIWVDPHKVEKIIVNESKGKKIEQYVISDMDLNLISQVGSNQLVHDAYTFPSGVPRNANTGLGAGAVSQGIHSQSSRNSRFMSQASNFAVDAVHVVHFSLSEGLDGQWPFGTSILENVFKIYKQKDLLEDAVIIYRIVRAPERLVFKIDVGGLSGPRAQQFVEKVKMEIYQRRIPGTSSSNKSAVDASYSPISITDNFFLATDSEGKGTTIETLPGGDNLGCFAMDTPIKLLDGRNLTISEIAAELAVGKKLCTLSCDPETGEIQPGIIDWAGTTRLSAQVMKVTLSNGESFICTPDHEFPQLNLGFVEIQDWQIGDQFITVSAGQTLTLVSKEILPDRIDVGTLTIDRGELLHDYHTYALSSGVFAKNSIDDLKFFQNKLFRGLGIPSSYLPTGPDDGTATFNDGKVGTAYIQEFRFSKYCARLQNNFTPILDHEFKMFLKNRGIEISSSDFNLLMWPPQSFSEYRQMQLDSERINIYSSIMGTNANRFMSQRYALKKYLGWTDEDILENERMWKEENASRLKSQTGQSPVDSNQLGLSSVGVKPQSGGFDMGGGFDDFGSSPPTEVQPTADENSAASSEVQNSATNGTGLEGL